MKPHGFAHVNNVDFDFHSFNCGFVSRDGGLTIGTQSSSFMKRTVSGRGSVTFTLVIFETVYPCRALKPITHMKLMTVPEWCDEKLVRLAQTIFFSGAQEDRLSVCFPR